MPSVALVVLDTLRKDRFDEQFDWLPGTRFERAYAPSHYTVPSHAGLFTGHYPSETGTNAESHEFDPPMPTLAERCREAGLTTRAFTANANVTREFDWDRGFDHFDGAWNCRHANAEADVFEWNAFIREHSDEGPARYAKALWACLTSDCDTLASLRHGAEIKYRTHTVEDSGAREALEYVRGTDFDDEEFLFVNLMEAHAPWDPPEAYRSVDLDVHPGFEETVRGDEIDGDRVRQAYDDSVRYLSDIYRDIYAELDAEFDHVVTCSDHGEMLGEHGIWGHGYGLYPELTHVPLVVSGLGGADERDETVGLLDVHRTVLELAGAVPDGGPESATGRGRDLREPLEPTEGVLTEYLGLNWFRRRTLAEADYADAADFDERLYGIALDEDYYGFETLDGFRAEGSTSVADPRARMASLVDDLTYHRGRKDGEYSEAVMEQLADLGYA
ncbi:sulfatase-like hydrolase/transferase [Haloglomus litoreum]|uniref:sulfatase-like hydrolase/transferase n=1 Tax=Haloglomus litoreum TaxID=3034026 RepID=UPI0023E8C326|nr:sulfatase-like hydrolase/transferase [Haloglomus sp. DT116]